MNYSLASTASHTSSYSFTEGFKLQEKFKAGVPFVASEEASIEFNFAATQVRQHKMLLT